MRYYSNTNVGNFNFKEETVIVEKSLLQRVKWNNVIKLLSIVALFVLAVNLFLNKFDEYDQTMNNYENAETVEIRVEQGQSLWEIADKYEFEGVGIRDRMFVIQQINNLNSDQVKAGQVLNVPVQ
jgi:cell division protein YceG involved in septum cleavage